MNKVRILVMDVDGTLTDGKVYIGPNGECFKSFDVKDGYAIRDLLPQYHIIPAIITGRASSIVENRAKELHILELYQGVQEKNQVMMKMLDKYHATMEETAYIGDDLPDLPCIQFCGKSGCPSNAVKEIRDTCDYVCKASGGHGAVREFIEWLIRQNKD